MPVIALQGVRGGSGTTSLLAALGWALHSLGERVLIVDFTASNQLCLHFNTPADQARGWMRSQLDGQPWQQSALRYLPGLDLIPFGLLSQQERFSLDRHNGQITAHWLRWLDPLKAEYDWVLLDLPAEESPLSQQVGQQADRLVRIITADANCHLRLHQQTFSSGTQFLLNQFTATSRLQQDIYQVWLHTLPGLLPVMMHRDEALAEALMMKQPVGEYRPHSLAAEEAITLANWMLMHLRSPA